MNIIIATGIYPPDIGGPARYAKHIAEVLKRDGHGVRVYAYRFEKRLPVGVRHVWYFMRLLRNIFWADGIIILDTFSTGLPAVLFGTLFRKKTLLRIGGDQLWEQYTERELVKLAEFYTKPRTLTLKEKLIKKGIHFVFHHATLLAFTSRWQADIEAAGYGFDTKKIRIVPNHFGPKVESSEPTEKRFCWHVRPVGFKNETVLRKAFAEAKKQVPDITLDDRVLPYGAVMESLRTCYAVLLPSISDIGPNFILEAIEHDRPFIMTKETGLYERLHDHGVFIEPTDVRALTESIVAFCDSDTYADAKHKVEAFTFTHSWDEIARAYVTLLNT